MRFGICIIYWKNRKLFALFFRYDSDDENERQKRTVRPKSSIVLLTPDLEAKYRQQSTSLTSFEI